MRTLLRIIFALFIVCGITKTTHAQISSQSTTLEEKHWKENQLIEPSTLASELKANTSHAVIFNIGLMQDIQGAKHIGEAKDAQNIEKLKKEVTSLPKDSEIIVYCGCCPLESKCPNVKPAYNELIKLGFTNVKVLDLPVNLKTNWIVPGYPMAGK
jgi:hypothetical protein